MGTEIDKPKRIGRPSMYSEELAVRICTELPFLDGGLEQLCKEDWMPSFQTIYQWLGDPEKKSFAESYARARKMMAEIQAFRAMSAALNAVDPQTARLAFDARKWIAAKLEPRVYGDKGDGDDTATKTVIITGGLS